MKDTRRQTITAPWVETVGKITVSVYSYKFTLPLSDSDMIVAHSLRMKSLLAFQSASAEIFEIYFHSSSL
jgi:glutamyl/glutaminyl-tRNA synthetase